MVTKENFPLALRLRDNFHALDAVFQEKVASLVAHQMGMTGNGQYRTSLKGHFFPLEVGVFLLWKPDEPMSISLKGPNAEDPGQDVLDLAMRVAEQIANCTGTSVWRADGMYPAAINFTATERVKLYNDVYRVVCEANASLVSPGAVSSEAVHPVLVSFGDSGRLRVEMPAHGTLVVGGKGGRDADALVEQLAEMLDGTITWEDKTLM